MSKEVKPVQGRKKMDKFLLFLRNRKERLRLKCRKVVGDFKKFSSSDDTTATMGAVLTILIDGLLITIGLAYWIKFNVFNVPIFGALWYMIKKQGLSAVTQILGSINFIRVGK